MSKTPNKQALRLARSHYWHESRRTWKLVLPGLISSGIGSVLVFYLPALMIARLLARYAESGIPELGEILPYVLAFGGFWLLGEAFWRLAIFFIIKAEVSSVRELYENAMSYMLEKDIAFFHNNFAGSLTKRTIGYAARYIDILDIVLFNIAPNTISAIFVSFILWQFSPWLAFGLLFMLALTISIVVPLIRKRKKLVIAREAASNKVSGYIADVYSNADAVKAFASEDKEKSRHLQNVLDLAKKMERSWHYQNAPIDIVVSPLYVLTNVIGMLLALQIARSTGASIEVVFVTFSYYGGLTRFMWEFNSTYKRLEGAISDASQFTELLLDAPKIRDAEKTEAFKAKSGAVELKDIAFTHDENNDALFKGLNLVISPGEKVGLVGHSGGGKTTLTKLLLRFMDIDSGTITIDGQDIRHITQNDLRQHITYVPQEPLLFHRTLSENIAYGKPDAGQAEIEKAAKLAHAHEFIEKLPKGYDTLVGERGVKLSGGQRQRVAIARAMIKDAPILLLDEATSALDSDSERLIQDALWKLMEGKTAIVIAHRLSTVQRMDRILVLENGEIIEEGSHKELLKNDGIYAELWKHQSGGFLEE